jgi:hypothetical protein
VVVSAVIMDRSDLLAGVGEHIPLEISTTTVSPDERKESGTAPKTSATQIT